MLTHKYADYFKLTQRQKLAVQQELFDFCVVLALELSDKDPDGWAWRIYEAAIVAGNRYLEDEEYEIVQALNDMIETYDLKRSVDQ